MSDTPGTYGEDDARDDRLPRRRTHFKELLLAGAIEAQAAEAAAAGAPPAGNTTYEELTCIGYEPQLKRLDAVVELKTESGFSGGICTDGSTEYVKFFASIDDGATWTELGTTSFTAWDVPGAKPLAFDVTLPVDLDEMCCRDENIVLVRAILSWQVPPGDHDDPIVWGNGLDTHIQIAPRTIASIFDMLACLDIGLELEQVGKVIDIGQVVEAAPAAELTPLQLHEKYSATKVPAGRYLFSHTAKLLASGPTLAATVKQPQLGIFPGLKDKIEIGPIIELFLDPQGNQSYEQLGCIGLNTTTSELVATIDVKLSSGYSGDLCSQGSREHVAFWADWGSGYEYVGTTSVAVHDIESMPADGLQYSAALPFAKALTERQPCGSGPRIVRVRAVLSWQTPPSDSDPYAVPVWGGHLETNILLLPGQPITGGPVLESIGSMPLPLIDGLGFATGTAIPGFTAVNSPFGGRVNFAGSVINPDTGQFGGPDIEYRILVSTNGGLNPTPMTEPFTVVTWTQGGFDPPQLQTPDPATGWCPLLEDTNTPGALVRVVGNLLGYWPTSGDGSIWIRMEARQAMAPIGATPWKRIQLDNTAPEATVEITSGGGSCGDFAVGDVIRGAYTASDNKDLNSVSIGVVMAMAGSSLAKDPATIVSTATSESGEWVLTTDVDPATEPSPQPCGYTIVATAVDNTIVDSGYVGRHGQAFTGLCLREPAA